MKLYLSSLAIPDTAAFTSLFAAKGRIAIIPTAWNVAPSEKSAPFYERTTRMLTDLGFDAEYVDLKDYGGKNAQLQQKLDEHAGVWVMGGNTFYLNYWLRESGFDQLLPGLLAQGFVYAGESAGAVIAGKTLHGIELLDNPADAPETLWEGLGLVDYGIIPHWGSQKYADRMDQTLDEMQQFVKVKTLTDSDAIIVKG